MAKRSTPAATASEIGARPAFPCSLPFDDGARCGMSVRLWLVSQTLGAVVTTHQTPATIADRAYAIIDELLRRESER